MLYDKLNKKKFDTQNFLFINKFSYTFSCNFVIVFSVEETFVASSLKLYSKFNAFRFIKTGYKSIFSRIIIPTFKFSCS